MKLLKAAIVASLLMLLTACGAPGPIMPDARSTSTSTADSSQTTPAGYRVVRGDTLYSIAFRYGLDWREVANWNGIAPPYTIRVGQNLRLSSQKAVAQRSTTPNRPTAGQTGGTTDVTGTIGPQPRRVESRTIATGDESAQTQPPVAENPATTTAAEPSATDTEPVRSTRTERTPPPATTPQPVRRTSETDIQTSGNGRSVAGTTWFWPTQGRLARRFNANDTRKGIHIAGEDGQAVRSTANGEVVYSGNGLIGYGELIIIKHSDSMLSAYAHNRERQVEQGDRVQAGQQIATMGEFEPNRPLLHFEIRRNGQPDDPLKYLPPR